MTAACPDGLSNTALLAEIYGTCGDTGVLNGPGTLGSLWADANTLLRPEFNLGLEKWGIDLAAYLPAPKFQVNPHDLDNCNYIVTQGSHPGGLMAGVGDGSVRFLPGGMADVAWQRAVAPRDGTPQGDW